MKAKKFENILNLILFLSAAKRIHIYVDKKVKTN